MNERDMTNPECLMCHKLMELVRDNPTQPYGGGEIKFIFAYGSVKFDEFIGSTQYEALICDECAEKYVEKMKRRGFGMHGEEVTPDRSNCKDFCEPDDFVPLILPEAKL